MISLAALALLGMISAVTAATVVPRSQQDQQQFESNEAALNRQFQSTEAQTARAFNALEAEKQRSWEEQMSSSQYQRAVQDMQVAGLNPASIGLGMNGASTPSSSAASQSYIPSGSMAQTGIANTSYFSNMFSMAAQQALANDKNFMNETIARLYANNAKQMNEATNATKKALAHYGKRSRFVYNEDGKMSAAVEYTDLMHPMYVKD